jgi:hypothetical protein
VPSPLESRCRPYQHYCRLSLSTLHLCGKANALMKTSARRCLCSHIHTRQSLCVLWSGLHSHTPMVVHECVHTNLQMCMLCVSECMSVCAHVVIVHHVLLMVYSVLLHCRRVSKTKCCRSLLRCRRCLHCQHHHIMCSSRPHSLHPPRLLLRPQVQCCESRIY